MMPARPSKKSFNRTPPTIAAVVIAVIVLAVGGYFVARRQEPRIPAREMTLTAADLQLPKDAEYSLPIMPVVDGVPKTTIDPALQIPETKGTVTLNIERVFPMREGANYTMFVRGSEIEYEAWIPPNYLEDGTVPLHIDGKVFPPGDYYIEIVEMTIDSVRTSVAETLFRVSK